MPHEDTPKHQRRAAEHQLHTGWLDGPVADPLILPIAAELVGLGLPVAVPASSVRTAARLLALGVHALVLKTALWRDPGLAAQIAAL